MKLLSAILSYEHDHRSAICVVSVIAFILIAQNAFVVGVVPEKDSSSQRWLWGVFVRCLAGVYCIAFASLATQIQALIGSKGIQPVAEFIQRAKEVHPVAWRRFLRFPSLLHLNTSDTMLRILTLGGIGLSLCVVLGIQSRVCLALMWMFYLSLVTCGGDFIFFPWDFLLLESGFLAIFLPPLEFLPFSVAAQSPPLHIIVWALKFLLCRLMLGFGIEKFWCPRDTQTLECSYIKYFLFWQPMPSPAAWAMHQLPLIVHKLSFFALFITEIAMPLLVFMPHPLPYFSAVAFAMLQFGIHLCGNYGVFNILTATLCITLCDSESSLRLALIPSTQGGQLDLQTFPIYFLVFSFAAVGCTFLVRQLRPGGVIWANYPAFIFSQKSKFWSEGLPESLRMVLKFLACFHFVHGWGVFRGSIVPLISIEIAASVDMIHWKKLEFRYYHKPQWFAPHQPRLDHLMFYESCRFRFSSRGVNGLNDVWPAKGPDCYFQRFLKKYCEGEPIVCALLQHDPFGASAGEGGEGGGDGSDSEERNIVCLRVNHYLDSRFSNWKKFKRRQQREEKDGVPEEEKEKFNYWKDRGLVLREIYEWDNVQRTITETDWPALREKLAAQRERRWAEEERQTEQARWVIRRADEKEPRIVELDTKERKKKNEKERENENEREKDREKDRGCKQGFV